MNLLFVFPDIGSDYINFSPAIMNLSSYVKKHLPEVNISFMHINNKHGIPYELNNISKNIFEKKPGLVGLTCTSYSYSESNEIAAKLKQDGLVCPIILGGSHAIIKPDDLITSSFDAFAIGESEYALVELCRRIIENKDITSTPGFYFKLGGELARNPPAKIIDNLDDLPYPDYQLMNTRKMLEIRNGWMSVAFSRGCPYNCSFCINDILQKQLKKYSVSYFRHKSIKNIITELKFLVNTYNKKIKIFKFEDDLLALNKDWFVDLMDMYKKNIFEPYRIPYVINIRANLINENIIKALSVSGCYELQIGVETGDDELRNKILNKQISDNQLLSAFSLCRKYKIRTLAYIMVGIPNETHDTIRTTIKMLNHMKPTLIRLTIFYPYYGTSIYKYCEREGLLKKEIIEYTNQYSNIPLIFSDISDTDILFYQLFFPWYLNILSENNPTANEIYEDALHKLKRNDPQQIARQTILEYDKKLSQVMLSQNISHFRYFSSNTNYVEYVETI